MPDTKPEPFGDLRPIAKRLAELLASATPVTPSPLEEPIKEPKTITVYVCPKIVEWNAITIGSKFSPVRETLVMPNQGQGYLAVFYTREEYDLVHPGFDPWVFKFTVMPNPYREKEQE